MLSRLLTIASHPRRSEHPTKDAHPERPPGTEGFPFVVFSTDSHPLSPCPPVPRYLHLLYALPSSVSCKPFVCRSCRNCRGVIANSKLMLANDPLIRLLSFSCTYVESILQPFCFQIQECNGGCTPPRETSHLPNRGGFVIRDRGVK